MKLNKINHWLPSIFCAGLSAICLATFIGFPTAWIIPFLCFLPLGFYFAAGVTSSLEKEIQELRLQIMELKKSAGQSI